MLTPTVTQWSTQRRLGSVLGLLFHEVQENDPRLPDGGLSQGSPSVRHCYLHPLLPAGPARRLQRMGLPSYGYCQT